MAENLSEMEMKIKELGGYLREAGLPVAPVEIAEAIEACYWVGTKGSRFKAALKSTLVKDSGDIPVFEELYWLCFEGGSLESFKEDWKWIDGPVSGSDGKGLGRSGYGAPVDILLATLEEGRLADLQQVAETVAASQEIDHASADNIEVLVENAQISLGWFGAIHYLNQAFKRGAISEQTYRHAQAKLSYIKHALEATIKSRLLATFGKGVFPTLAKRRSFRHKDFASLSDSQMIEIEKQVRALGKRLAARLAGRYKPWHKGRFDMQRIVRRALRTGGIPLKILRKDKVRKKPELIVLCDVSGSVARFSRFMLQLTYAIQSSFKKVRSFVFVDQVAEVTGFLTERDIDQAMEEALKTASVSRTGSSDYGRVFEQFHKEIVPQLNPRATLIVLGDARNNWRPDGRWELQQISKSVERLIWLNPQPGESWNTRDSIARLYEPYCTHFLECRNLEQLEEVVRRVF